MAKLTNHINAYYLREKQLRKEEFISDTIDDLLLMAESKNDTEEYNYTTILHKTPYSESDIIKIKDCLQLRGFYVDTVYHNSYEEEYWEVNVWW